SVCDYDTAAPAITCPSDLALKCTGGCTPLPDGTVFAATAIDAVDGELEVASNAPACFNLGVTEVTFSATDQAGKKADCKAKVTVTDTAAPVISCPEKVTLECAGQDGTPSAKLPENFQAAAADGCDSAVTITNNIPANFNKGENTVAFTATDDSGNVSTCTAPVSVKDTTVPNISCPANITLECEGTTGIAKTSASLAGFTATATDVCDNSLVLSHNMPEYFATGTTTAVTFSAVDDAGLSASCTATVTVKDTIAPVIACPGRTIINKSSELDRTKFNAVCSDLCSKTTGSNNLPADLDDLRKGENPITFTCKDEYGNSSSCTAVLEIQTGNDPIIYCPSDLTICEGDSIPDSHKATAYDHKGNPLPVTRSISANPPLGVHTVTWTATDSKGRKASCTSKVTVITCAVRITCPNNLTVVQTIDAGIPFSSIAGNFRATAVDYKNAALSVTHDAPTTLPVGTTTVIFTAADSGGRKASCSATVTVTSKPIPQPEPVTLTITCPGDRNVECGTIAISGFTAASNIAGVTITDDRPAVFSGCNTTTVVTFTAQDNSGNTAGCSSAVSVTDSVAPKITCPGNMLLTTASEFKAENFQAAATDSCGTVLIVDNLPPNNNFSIGINYITFTATDQCGNSAACTAAVTLEPGNAPTIICPADLTIEQTTDAGIYFSSIAASFQATAYDHKGNALTVTNNAPSILPPGSTVVTFTATDSKLSKKSSSCMATVTVTKHVEEPKTEVTSEDKETEENAGDTNSLSDTSADTSGNSGSSDNNTSGTTGDNDSGASGNIVSGDNGGSGTNNTSGSAGNTGTNGDTTGAAGNNESVGTTGGSDDNSGSATNNATGSVGDNASGASGNTTSGDNSGSATDNTTGSTGDKTGTTGDTTGAAGNNESAGNNDSGNAITATVLTVSVVSGDGGQPDLSANENPAGASGSADTTPAAGNEPGKPEAPAPMVVIVSPIDGAIVRTNQITVIYLVNGLNKSVTKDLTEGKNVITVSETNEAGVSGSDSIVVTYDPNTVLLSILSPANGTVVTSSPVRITYLLEGMTKSVNRALVEGENTITVTDTDSTGQAQSAAVNIILDSTAPKVVITSPGNGVVLAVSPITVNYLVDGNARAKSQTLTEGLNIIVVEESDSLGRVGSDSVAVTLKSTAPKVVITSPENEAVVAATPITVTYTVDGVVKTLLRELGAGENTVEVVETDVFGRKGKAQIEVTLNSKAPNVRITSPKNAAVVEASPVNVTYTVDNKKAKTVSKDLGEGINVITIKEESNSGKSSITGSDSITVTLDKTPPAVNIISPKDGSLVSQSPLVVVYTLDGIIKTSVKELEEGVNNLVIEEKDALGRSGSASVKVIFDAHIPLVNITSPANNSVLTTTPVLVSYNVEGKAKSVTWDLQAGQNIITVQEAAGNGLVGMASISVIYKPSAESALLLCPQDVTLEQQSPQGTRITLQAVSADSNNPLTDIGSDAPEVFPSGTTIVTFSGKNPQGEIVNCSSKVTVIDTTPPIIDLLLSPRKEEYNNTEILSIGYVITDKGDSNPMVKLELNNGHQTVDITAPSPIMLNLAHYVGDNTLIITTIDSYGNKANSTASFKVVEKVNAQ
ncbi:MAG: HYR domain-containing protein, partial [Candidatus Schekmanbacteria bacterium]|nr:HYR domain-containing protein [Candidatus Schekmanbacteria bacterium]